MANNIQENAHLHFSLFVGGAVNATGGYNFPEKQNFIDPLLIQNDFDYCRFIGDTPYPLLILN